MSDDKRGTGGLTLEPPGGEREDAPEIGFAPGLEEDFPVGPLPETSSPTVQTVQTAKTGAGIYPLAEAAISRLLGHHGAQALARDVELPTAEEGLAAEHDLAAEDEPAAEEQNSIPEKFDLGPAITRPTTEIQRPPEEKVAGDDGASHAEADLGEHMDEMVEMVLVGGDDGAPPSVHLRFKPEYLGGLYLRLERTDEGLFARFQVPDAHTRRTIDGQVDLLLSRLRDKGMRIAGHEIVIEPR